MEVLRALAVLAEPPGAGVEALATALHLPRSPRPDEFVALFEQDLPPYAALYVGPEGALGGEVADRVAGFWRALGLDPPTEPDHLTTLLALYAMLADAESEATDDRRRAAAGRARAACLWEHLLSWVPVFLEKVVALGSEPYVAWAAVLRETLKAEAERIEMPALPLHLRTAPELPAGNAEAEGWITALLTPVSAGLVLTRSDLADGARRLGLAIRAGDRREALRSLLAQAPTGAAAWLAGEARHAAALRTLEAPWLGAVAEFWTARATTMAAALEHVTQGS